MGSQGMPKLGVPGGSGHPLPQAGQQRGTPGCPGLHPATRNYCITIQYVSTKEQNILYIIWILTLDEGILLYLKDPSLFPYY